MRGLVMSFLNIVSGGLEAGAERARVRPTTTTAKKTTKTV